MALLNVARFFSHAFLWLIDLSKKVAQKVKIKISSFMRQNEKCILLKSRLEFLKIYHMWGVVMRGWQ